MPGNDLNHRVNALWLQALRGFLFAAAVVIGISATLYQVLAPSASSADPSSLSLPGALFVVMALIAAAAAGVAATSPLSVRYRNLFLSVAAAAGAYHIVQFARFGNW